MLSAVGFDHVVTCNVVANGRLGAGMTKIELRSHFEKFVEAQVETGRFASASDVVETALGLLEEREAEREASLARIRGLIQESLDDPRPLIPAEEVFADLRARLRAI